MQYHCSACSGSLTVMMGYETLARVSSDIKPFGVGGEISECQVCGLIQKPDTSDWYNEIERIYKNYEMFSSSSSLSEPLSFDPAPENTNPRTQELLHFVFNRTGLSTNIEVLDVGSGTGPIIAAMGVVRPDIRVYSHDISRKYLDQLNKYENFGGLFVCEIEQIDMSFDLITLNHTLEHIPDGVSFLKRLSKLLKQDGYIVIQVPNVAENTYDLLVADHKYHFSCETLKKLISKTGLHVHSFADNVIAKQLTLVASKRRPEETFIEISHSSGLPLNKLLTDLKDRINTARAVAKDGRVTAIFGTGTASCVIAQALNFNFDFFIDDDPNRQGCLFLDKPVLSRDDQSLNSRPNGVVIIPILPTTTATKIAKALEATGKVTVCI